jgi:hypothetical protein
VRVALVANGASGGGLDPAPLVRAMSEHGADVTVHGCTTTDLERVTAEYDAYALVVGS